jgi:hypothetical protein
VISISIELLAEEAVNSIGAVPFTLVGGILNKKRDSPQFPNARITWFR